MYTCGSRTVFQRVDGNIWLKLFSHLFCHRVPWFHLHNVMHCWNKSHKQSVTPSTSDHLLDYIKGESIMTNTKTRANQGLKQNLYVVNVLQAITLIPRYTYFAPSSMPNVQDFYSEDSRILLGVIWILKPERYTNLFRILWWRPASHLCWRLTF